MKNDYSSNGKVIVYDHSNFNHHAALKSFLPDSLYWTVAVNGDYTLSFTAYDDGSEAFSMLTGQNVILDHGEFFVIKQTSDTKANGGTALQISASQVYTELSRHRIASNTYDPDAQQSTAPTDSDQNNQSDQITLDGTATTVTPDKILHYYIGNANGQNSCGMKWAVHGNFNAQPVVFEATDVKSGISKITETWTDAVIYPHGYCVDVYTHDEFYKSYGHRIDYLHDTSQVQLDTDTTVIVNQVRAVGATYSSSGTGTADTGLPNGALGAGSGAVAADARKYLGVPYVWGGAGGARGGNPYSGMDCSSFVSQVYKDFGINIPAYTVAMESSFHEIPYSQVTTGDVGFYGPHGGTHHICLMLDHNTMIYEPQPGEKCKTEPVNYYRPSWFARNDQMAAVVAKSSDDSGTATTETYNDTSAQYYFQPFIVRDKESIKRWGIFEGEDVTNDTITDAGQMKDYALKQMVPNPSISITVTKITNEKPIIGEKIRLEIKPINYVTFVNVTGFTWYPYSNSTATTINLNSNPKTILDYDASFHNSTEKTSTIVNNWQKMTWTKQEVRTFGENIQNADDDSNKSGSTKKTG